MIWFGAMTVNQRDEFLKLSKDARFQKVIQRFFAESQTKLLDADFVFAGSHFYKHKDGTQSYSAEQGDFVCVSNFSSAMIDLATPSSQSNDELMWEPFTEKLPPTGTEVTIELVPVFTEEKALPLK